MTKIHTFPCGCQVDFDNLKSIKEYTEEYPDCPAVWDSLANGNVKLVWQVESPLGKRWTKEIKPRSIEELSDVVTVIRPSCLKSIESDGKNITQHYADRKNGKEETVYLHPKLKELLGNTYGYILYQEQMLLIAKEIAGFTLQEADSLRKASGKKIASLMSEMKTLFLTKAKEKNVVPYNVAEQLFDWIEKSNRYSFNLSHATAYAVLGYISAYTKVHFPLLYYNACLSEVVNEPDTYTKIQEIVDDAKLNNIVINAPDLRYSENNFTIRNKQIFFGLSSIKSVGEKAITKLQDALQSLEKPIADLTWIDFLILVVPKTTKTVVQNFIAVGVLDYIGVSRIKMKYEYELWQKLTERELKWVIEQYSQKEWKTALSVFESVAGEFKLASNRKKTIEDIITLLKYPTQNLDDSAQITARTELELLGASITKNTVDEYGLGESNSNCLEVHSGDCPRPAFLAVEIKNVNTFLTKRGQSAGKHMARMVVSDSTATLDNVVVFAEAYEEFQDLLKPKRVVLLCGEKDLKYNSFNVRKVFRLKANKGT